MMPTYADVVKYGRSAQGKVSSRAIHASRTSDAVLNTAPDITSLVLYSRGGPEIRDKIKKCPLMDLPFHIRVKILDLVIVPHVIPNFRHKRRVRPWISTPKIARAGNTRLRLEALMIYIEKSTIELHEEPLYPSIRAWLSSIDFSGLSGDTSYRNGLDAVKTLRFPVLRRFTSRLQHSKVPHSDLRLMTECHRLQTIVLEADRVALVFDDDNNPSYYMPESISRLVRGTVIPQILACKNLEALNLRLMYWLDEDSHYANFSQAVVEGQTRLQTWFEQEFQKREALVRVPWITH